MADQYTPTTEEMVRSYSLPSVVTNPQRADETFAEYLSRISIEGHQDQMRSEEAARRWLAAHDAQVRTEALRDAAVTIEIVTLRGDQVVRREGPTKTAQNWLFAEADRIAETSSPSPSEHDLDRDLICRRCGGGITAREIVDGRQTCGDTNQQERSTK